MIAEAMRKQRNGVPLTIAEFYESNEIRKNQRKIEKRFKKVKTVLRQTF